MNHTSVEKLYFKPNIFQNLESKLSKFKRLRLHDIEEKISKDES